MLASPTFSFSRSKNKFWERASNLRPTPVPCPISHSLQVSQETKLRQALEVGLYMASAQYNPILKLGYNIINCTYDRLLLLLDLKS